MTEIVILKDGKEKKVWYQNRGDSNQRTIPDAHMIYISWADGSMGGQTRISYLEGLSRSFQMLTQIENSRLMWNIMNSGKRTKMIIPVGDLSPYKADILKRMYMIYSLDKRTKKLFESLYYYKGVGVCL